MHRSILLTALAAGLSMGATFTGASAQSVELYVGPPAAYDSYYDYGAYPTYGYGPRVYGYYYGANDRHLRQPEDYRTGSKRWWKQMDRTGRGGQQN